MATVSKIWKQIGKKHPKFRISHGTEKLLLLTFIRWWVWEFGAYKSTWCSFRTIVVGTSCKTDAHSNVFGQQTPHTRYDSRWAIFVRMEIACCNMSERTMQKYDS
eukprot:1910978-Amphidinium_carterae.1